MQLGGAIFAASFLCISAVWLRPGEPVVVATDYGDSRQVSAHIWDGESVGNRRVYPLSVVPGGVYTAAEADRARQADPVIAAHYEGIAIPRLRRILLEQPMLRYVSFRRGNEVYWTRGPMEIPAGETVLADGDSVVRARCGNRLSEKPQEPVLPASERQPTATDFEIPLPPEMAPPALVAAIPPGGSVAVAPVRPFVKCPLAATESGENLDETESSWEGSGEDHPAGGQKRTAGLKQAELCLAAPPAAEVAEGGGVGEGLVSPAPPARGSGGSATSNRTAALGGRVPGFRGFQVFGAGAFPGSLPLPSQNSAIAGNLSVGTMNPGLFLPLPESVLPQLPAFSGLPASATEGVFAVLALGGGRPQTYTLALPTDSLSLPASAAAAPGSMPAGIAGQVAFGSGGGGGQPAPSQPLLYNPFAQVSSTVLVPAIVPGLPVSAVLFERPQNEGVMMPGSGSGGGGAGGAAELISSGGSTGGFGEELTPVETAVPEPWTVVLAGTGLLGMGSLRIGRGR